MEKKNYNATIDIVKYLCAIMIVDSHVRLINIENSFLFELFRFALYFFHCAFGYYFLKSIKRNDKNIISKNVKRLLPPLLFWIVIYTLLNLYNNVLSGRTSINEFMKLNLISLFINGTGFHLWFMASLIIYVVIATLLYKNNKLKVLYPISIVLYIVGLLESYYVFVGDKLPLISNLINTKFFTTYCRLFMHGLPMFTMGLYISDNDEKLMKIEDNKLIWCSLLLFVLVCAEIVLVLKYVDLKTNICTLFLCLFTFVFFILCLKKPNNQYNELGKVAKYISTFMYYSHPLVRTILVSIMMRVFNVELPMLVNTIIVVIICTIVGYLLKKLNIKFINKLVS